MSNVSAVIKEMIRQQILLLHTCLICRVLKVYEDGTAKIHPLTMVQTISGEVKQHQALDQVKDYISIDNICVVLFAERDISKALTGEYALPSVCRHHSLSDGIIVGTIGSTNKKEITE